MLGIIGAMDEEVARLKEAMSNVAIKTKASMDFYSGEMNGKNVVIVRSGIGKVNAGICAQILIDEYNVDYIINTGIAGGLNPEINIGDIVLSTDTVQHDVDATGFGYKVGVIPRMETSVFVADDKLREFAKKASKKVNPDIEVFEGRVVSGDQFISDKSKKDYLVTEFQGYCAEMEGAAIAQVAYLNDVPFLIIRAISDKADESATVDYPVFEAKAIENTVKLLNEMIDNI